MTRVTKEMMYNSLKTVKRITNNPRLWIYEANGKCQLWSDGKTISDMYSKRELYEYMRGYLRIKMEEQEE